MQLIVISSPKYVKNEAEIVNTLFSEGLDNFHLRKPGEHAWGMKSFLSRILPMYHKYIVVHSHYEVAVEFGLKGVHLNGEFKAGKGHQRLRKNIADWQNEGFTVSTSVHSMDELLNTKHSYDYVMASPVFPSISKPGYVPSEDWDIKPVRKLFRSTPIALGGINAKNIDLVPKMGFEGAATIGAIWSVPDEAIESFKIMKTKCRETAPLY